MMTVGINATALSSARKNGFETCEENVYCIDSRLLYRLSHDVNKIKVYSTNRRPDNHYSFRLICLIQ
jgi:hypothetical protein